MHILDIFACNCFYIILGMNDYRTSTSSCVFSNLKIEELAVILRLAKTVPDTNVSARDGSLSETSESERVAVHLVLKMH